MTAHNLAENVELESFTDLSKDLGPSEDFGVQGLIGANTSQGSQVGQEVEKSQG